MRREASGVGRLGGGIQGRSECRVQIARGGELGLARRVKPQEGGKSSGLAGGAGGAGAGWWLVAADAARRGGFCGASLGASVSVSWVRRVGGGR